MAELLPTTRCHFLTIPPEMRLEIYDHVFDRGGHARLAFLDHVFCERLDYDRRKGRLQVDSRLNAALLLSCKTVYQEAREIFHSRINYVLDVEGGSTRICSGEPARDLGPMQAFSTLVRIRKATLCIHHIQDDEQKAVLRRLALLLEGLEYCSSVDHLKINLHKSASAGFRDVCEALRTIKCSGKIEVWADRVGNEYPDREWKTVKETAEHIGGELVDDDDVNILRR